MENRPPQKKIWLASPMMHGDEQRWADDAIRTNWVSTVGANIDAIEEQTSEMTGRGHAVALSTGTAALHLAVRLCGEKLYGQPDPGKGALDGKRVFCSDLTFAASANPVAYEGGEAVFIDAEYETWNMDPDALERAFVLYPEVRLIICVHLYGTPAKLDRIRSIADAHGALLIEDAAEAFGAVYRGEPVGSFGDFSILSFNGNKIITGSSGGMLLSDSREDAERIRKWSTQSREPALWYQHEELGYNYRMSNVIAGVVRGQLPHLAEHIEGKRRIRERYLEGLRGLPVVPNPCAAEDCEPNYWLSCICIEGEAISEKCSPASVLAELSGQNIEGRPIWKPMHLQPLYRRNTFVTADKAGAPVESAGGERTRKYGVGDDIFARGLCLPSDLNMTAEEQERVIGIVRSCLERNK